MSFDKANFRRSPRSPKKPQSERQTVSCGNLFTPPIRRSGGRLILKLGRPLQISHTKFLPASSRDAGRACWGKVFPAALWGAGFPAHRGSGQSPRLRSRRPNPSAVGAWCHQQASLSSFLECRFLRVRAAAAVPSPASGSGAVVATTSATATAAAAGGARAQNTVS